MKSILVLLPLLLVLDAFAGGGVGTRGGGAANSQAFVTQAWNTYFQLNKLYPKGAPRIDLPKLKTAIETTKVDFTEERLVLDGIEKDAINDIEKKTITVNTWSYVQLSTSRQKKLNLHEYLRLAGVDDSNYQVSTPLLIGLEGNPLVGLDDLTASALGQIQWIQLEKTKDKARLCYNLANLERSTREAIQIARESDRDVIDFMAIGRLRIWADAPNHFCMSEVFYHTTGKSSRPTHKGMECYLRLIERDLKIIQGDIARFLGKSAAAPGEIWDSYRGKFNGCG